MSTAMTAQTDQRTADGIFERKVRLIGANDKQLSIFLKLPPGARSGADASGVFAFCTWQSDPDVIRGVLRNDSGGVADVLGFAAKHNLAVVSWTTFAGKQTFDKGRSFDEMSRSEPPEAANIRWLVSTGELEAGYPAAKRFYAAARALNYPIIFHGEPKVAHENNANIDRLSTAFFDYVVGQLKAAAAGKLAPVEERFVGNYFTHEFVPWAQGAKVPEMFRAILPSREIAEAWGFEAEEP